jgi:dTDP-4-amino-4,6-dideoxygalactose transaminase
MDVGAFYRKHRAEIDAAVARVLNSGWFILGEECRSFERLFAAEFDLGGAVGVASGTDAVTLALKALGIEPGDRVATVSHTAVATVAAIELAGARPVLIDIGPETFAMDPESLHRAFADSAPIRAVVAVHLYGHPADMIAIGSICREHGALLIEDCAQAHGAKIGDAFVGTFGDAAAFSFYPTKNLGAFGDGGAVCAKDSAIVAKLFVLREYGWVKRYISDVPGMNSRLDELQAAILKVRLAELANGNARRREIAASYTRGLAGAPLTLPIERPGMRHVYHQYVIRFHDRDRLSAQLKAEGIGSNVHYPLPVHLQPAYLGRVAVGPTGLANTETAAREVLSLPMYPELSDDEVARVIATLSAALR